jgi:8-amino-7-oxononanoate synthase
MQESDPFAPDLQALVDQGLLRTLRPVVGPQGPSLTLADGTALLNLSSNDYLGLAAHPHLLTAARDALVREGFGAGASRLITGNFDAHRQLEDSLRTWKRTEAALLFGSGYQANVGILQALANHDDVIYSDALNHASLIDGMRLSRATVRIYPHRDVTALANQLHADRTAGFRRRFVVSETLFSMDGDLAPVTLLRALAREHHALLVLDEAHANGVIGPEGRGLAAEAGVTPDVEVGTLGKALGAYGAFVVGSATLCALLLQRARSLVFSTSLPPSVAAAANAAVHLLRAEEGAARQSTLRSNARAFSSRLAHHGLARQTDLPIIPLVIGDAGRTMDVAHQLSEQGLLAHGIRPPTVPSGSSRIRLTVSALHHPDALKAAADTIAVAARS